MIFSGRFDAFGAITRLADTQPRLAHFLTMRVLGWMSPFNAHLGAQMLSWTDQGCTIRLRRRRGVRNHVKSIHAGALFTLAETCAGLSVIRHFPFSRFRPLMSEVRITYSKQARGTVTGACVLEADTIKAIHGQLASGESASVDLVTLITNEAGEETARATTVWQIKPWTYVRTTP